MCYCSDCQAYARFLGREDVLEAQGGTDLYQMAPGRVRIDEGADKLRCVRLSDKGMFRWYCGECKTPVGNTLGARIPFVGMSKAMMDHAADGSDRDQVLGKPIAYMQTKFASGAGFPGGDHGASVFTFVARSAKLLAKWKLSGAGKPSPFFDDKRHPRATPQVLSAEERGALSC